MKARRVFSSGQSPARWYGASHFGQAVNIVPSSWQVGQKSSHVAGCVSLHPRHTDTRADSSPRPV